MLPSGPEVGPGHEAGEVTLAAEAGPVTGAGMSLRFYP